MTRAGPALHRPPVAVGPEPSRWRPRPQVLAQLLIGLWLFGTGEGLLVHSGLGVSPWTVLAQGVSVQTPLAVGVATVAISFVVLLAWLPLRQRPGLGTLLNAVVIGVAIDVTLAVLAGQPDPIAIRLGEVALGIGLVAVGSGLYLTCRLGPGPRDGLMTGLQRRTGRSLRLVRTLIEGAALAVGFVLGGTVGIGTVAFALGIGPAVQAALRVIDRRPEEPL